MDFWSSYYHINKRIIEVYIAKKAVHFKFLVVVNIDFINALAILYNQLVR